MPEDSGDEEEPNLVGEELKTDVIDLLIPKADEASLDTRIGMLNIDQRRVFDSITQHLEHQLSHENAPVLSLNQYINF